MGDVTLRVATMRPDEVSNFDLGLSINELKIIFMEHNIGGYDHNTLGCNFFIGEEGKIKLMKILKGEFEPEKKRKKKKMNIQVNYDDDYDY